MSQQPKALSGTSLDISAENRARLKALFPSVFTETVNDKGELVESVDFEKLKAELGTFTDLFEARRERYGMDWPGKKEALRLIQTPSAATLKPCREESVNFDTTENLFIEGDNLEVLKLLQKSYYGKVKMIDIDPPYNTGKEFIYPDNYSESLETYLEYAGLIDGKGKKFSTNTPNEGRFHTKWLNMMYPRLYLARNLLRDDGVIFIHIDDNEVSNLRKMCDEIFGEENFIDCVIWKKRYGGGAKEKYLVTLHEYALFYAKNKELLGELFIPLDKESINRYYKLKDENYHIRGSYRTHPLEAGSAVDDRPNLIFPIKAPDGTQILPERQWYWNEERVKESIKKREIEFIKGKNGWTVHSKQYLKDENGEIRQAKAFSLIDDVYSQHGTNEMIDIFGNAKVFSYPKPSNLLVQLINIGTNNDRDAIILDFFSGSATSAHAVLDLNKQDGGNRKFIMVQLPEPCAEDSEAFKAGYKTIADIGKERIRRVIKKLTPSNSPLTGGEQQARDQVSIFDANPEAMNKRGFMNYNVELKNRSREMRKNPTSAEEKLWNEFLRARPEGFKFTRQKPLQNFIVDFYCSEKLLAIEADGGIHQEQKEYDEQRDTYLKASGISMIRFSNEDILNDFINVKAKIIEALKSPCQGGFRGLGVRGLEGLGFKVLKLDKSNFKQWQKLAPDANPDQIEKQLFDHIDHIDHKATPEDLLFEILIKAGFMPTEKVQTITLAGVPVFSIADGGLLICLADTVTKELINAVAEAEPMQFICLDKAFGGNDQLKANAVQTFNARNMGREKANQIVFRTV